MIGNFNIVTEKDIIEAREREKRRQAELERQQRIFNPKTRKIGIDKNALQAQIDEKKEKEEREKEYQRAFDRQMVKNNELAVTLAAREKQEKERILQDLNEYRKTYQQQWKSRDFDLIDPYNLKKQIPLRSTDAEVGLPCGQKFDGEDLHAEERAKIMAEQRSHWLKQQIQENYSKSADEKAAQIALEQAVIARDKRALELELIERDCKKQLEAANARINQILAEEHKNKISSEVQNEKEDELAEIYNTLSSDLLTESPVASKSVFGPHRTIVYMYKGMSPEEKAAIRKMQLNQIAEQQMKRTIEKETEKEWNHQTKQTTNVATFLDTELQQKRRNIAKQIKEENLMLSKQQKDKQFYYDKVVFTNEPTEEYFNKFNTTSR